MLKVYYFDRNYAKNHSWGTRHFSDGLFHHYSDVIMGMVAFPITSFTIVYSIVYSGKGERDQSSASLAFVRGIHWWPVNSPHKGPVTRKMLPFDDVIMWRICITGLQGIHLCLLAVSQLTKRCLCNIISNTEGRHSLPVLALGHPCIRSWDEPTGPRHHGGCRSADTMPSVAVMPTLQLLNIIRVAWYTSIALHNR